MPVACTILPCSDGAYLPTYLRNVYQWLHFYLHVLSITAPQGAGPQDRGESAGGRVAVRKVSSSRGSLLPGHRTGGRSHWVSIPSGPDGHTQRLDIGWPWPVFFKINFKNWVVKKIKKIEQIGRLFGTRRLFGTFSFNKKRNSELFLQNSGLVQIRW